MVQVSKFALAAVLSLLQAQAFAFGCRAGDQEISTTSWTDSFPCTMSGYCLATDYNPATGNYESFYGFHANCPGEQKRETTIHNCSSDDGFIYQETEVGPIGICQLN